MLHSFASALGACKGNTNFNSNEKSLVKLTGESLNVRDDALFKKISQTTLCQQTSNSISTSNELNHSKPVSQKKLMTSNHKINILAPPQLTLV